MALNQAVGLLCNAVTEISFDCTHRDDPSLCIPNVDITCISVQGLRRADDTFVMMRTIMTMMLRTALVNLMTMIRHLVLPDFGW